MRLLLLGLTVQAVSGLVARGCGVIPCSSLLPPRLPPPCSSLFAQRELEEGAEWQGLISRITEYGAFVTLGHEQHQGLLHISSLTPERIDPEDVPRYVEKSVGPVGSRVKVLVKSLQFKPKGRGKRVSLELIEALPKQDLDELVFARPPR